MRTVPAVRLYRRHEQHMTTADPVAKTTRRPRRAIGGLDAASFALALLLALPIASVCVSIFSGPSATFTHIAATVLPEYVFNTLSIVVLVVIGVLLIGVPAAWLTACCEFPGR